jgi:hypothetical protein
MIRADAALPLTDKHTFPEDVAHTDEETDVQEEELLR